jgi:hypothetical protein
VSVPEPPAPPQPMEGTLLETETARPSVTITRNAKGQAQFSVKVYGADSTEEDALAASRVAQQIYDGLTIKYGLGG